MSPDRLPIEPATKVGALLDAYPELEDVLIAMAPPFRKLRNPLLRRSIAKIATLRQASAAAGLDLREMIDALRAEVQQAPISAAVTVAEVDYLGAAPEWFSPGCVKVRIDDRDGAADDMAITRVLRGLKDLGEHEAVELTSTFLPAPGIDAARAKGLTTWTTREKQALFLTYFAK